eukprot:CAMPEP_0179031348 /NCGR_PEP_ID=MMETSP0796-20121207/11024_1 /TAXON_ID=73915 /ORGANISM="Pyrodinium bahamense, Strain pbaha01" /LENGTH=518 /DNA_ID=CAMNT_0020727537 /DNA_START=139 /DNA_END=1693 /DNA_ORIENTATION=-
MLQIGLGTFGTFFQNLTVPSEVYPGVSWLLEAASNRSRSLQAVGVEPVPEHAERCEAAGATLVEAAVGRQDQNVEVHAITPECYKKYTEMVRPTELQSFEDLVLFLRNMSCVGQAHPEFGRFSAELAKFGVKVEAQPIRARAVTYGGLARMLHFNGVEVLLIDAEGYDCKILQSMIDHCTQQGNEKAWPDIIQFETMGHSNWMGDSSSSDAEAEMCRCLEGHGYHVACHGTDTQLVRGTALAAEVRLQRWVETFRCDRCRVRGQDGMPFTFCSGMGALCRGCMGLFDLFGPSAWEWENVPGDAKLASLTTNGEHLWGVDFEGRACCCRDGHWERFGMQLRHISVSKDASQIWGVDDAGRVFQCASQGSDQWKEVPDSPRLVHVAVSGDGWWVWGTDCRGRIFFSSTVPARRQWQNISGWLSQVSISHNSKHIWGVNPSGKVYYRFGWAGTWIAMPGRLCQVTVSGDGCHVWGVNDGNQIFYRPGYSGSWTRVPGWLTQVCASEDGSRVWGTDTFSHVW